jgi:hypothetical protein
MASEIPNAPREHNDQYINEKKTSGKKNPKAPQTMRTDSLTPPPNDGKTACQCHYKSPHWGWKLLEGAALTAAVVYAFLTYLMWRESHQNFVVDQRGWIGAVTDFPSVVNQGTQLQTHLNVFNHGKTPALKIHLECTVSRQTNTDIVRFDYSKIHTVSDMGMLTPNSYTTIECGAGEQGESDTLSKNQADDLTSGRAYLAVHGLGTYDDIFGGVHWFRFCFWRSYYSGGSYNAGSCAAFNDTGDGPLPGAWTNK